MLLGVTTTQTNRRVCAKWYSLFWWGYPTGGTSGGHHSPLMSDSPTHAAASWDCEW